MAENPYVSVIKVWAAMVWADDVVTPHEAKAMRRLISSSDLTDTEKATAFGFLEKKVELDTTALAHLPAAEREGVYRAAVQLSAVDDDIADSEIDFLERLRDGLGLDEETAERIEDSVANG
jgi:uncharacterized tellurite resistance protein B-like protein